MYRQSQGTRNYGKLSSHAILVKSCENHAFAKEITKYLIDLTKKILVRVIFHFSTL